MKHSASHKTIYIPYMCDHCYVLEAALEAHGLRAETLPPPDEESLAIGMDLCRGRECSPCFTSTGDIIRRARQPDFVPDRAVMLIAAASGLCRFGAYRELQRVILDEQGLGAVEIISPNANNAYQGFGDNATALRKLIWQGIVAVDLLQKLVYAHRPYEREPGQTDRLYQACLRDITAAVRAGGGRQVQAALKRLAKEFEALPVDRSVRRPVIGVVGEIYLRLNDFSNQSIVQKIEAAGGEVEVATLMEWFYFTNWNYADLTRELGRYGDFLATLISDLHQRFEERRLAKTVAHLLPDPLESPMTELVRDVRPHYDPVMGMETEAGLTLGKAVELAKKGLCGIVNVMPFGCMPGIVVAGMAPRFRADLNNIPWLDISYDAQGGTNVNTRLEAFMYQAKQFQRQTAGAAHKP
jgi:predicted nucleotide-binding protein (sugar kinase/HSP70/actin superfamily)